MFIKEYETSSFRYWGGVIRFVMGEFLPLLSFHCTIACKDSVISLFSCLSLLWKSVIGSLMYSTCMTGFVSSIVVYNCYSHC